MVNFGPLAAEIGLVVWGTPANFNGFRVLAVLLHIILVVGVSQTLRRSTEGATYIRQGYHHVRHRPTFLVWFVLSVFLYLLYHCICSIMYFIVHAAFVRIKLMMMMTQTASRSARPFLYKRYSRFWAGDCSYRVSLYFTI